MGYSNLLIAPIQGMTATQRAEAISYELWAIARPPQVRQPEDTAYLFAWHTHPTTGQCVLQSITDYIIKVHPQNNLTNLIALFPDLSEGEKTALAGYITSSQQFAFGNIIPSNSTTLTDAEMQEGGWYEQINETE